MQFSTLLGGQDRARRAGHPNRGDGRDRSLLVSAGATQSKMSGTVNRWVPSWSQLGEALRGIRPLPQCDTTGHLPIDGCAYRNHGGGETCSSLRRSVGPSCPRVRPRGRILGFRFTAEEQKRTEAAAKAKKQSVSDWIWEAINVAIQ
jgi:hypothetical protein